MKKIATVAATLAILAGLIGHRLAFADSTTTRFGMTKPDVGSTNWGPKINTNYDIIDNAAGISISNTFSNANYFTGVVVIGGTTYTGTGLGEVRKDQNADSIFRITNGNNTASAQAREIITVGGTSAGDAYWTSSNGTNHWSFGLDNSDLASFKIANNSSLGPSDRLNIYGTTASFRVNGVAVASFTTTGCPLQGTITNDSAAAGWIGEYVSTTSTNYNTISTSGQYFDVLSMTLTAGDWDLDGTVVFNRNAATFSNTNAIEVCLGGTAAGNNATGCTFPINYISDQDTYPTSFSIITKSPQRYRLSLPTATTVYLKGQFQTFTSGNPKVRGYMNARRIR